MFMNGKNYITVIIGLLVTSVVVFFIVYSNRPIRIGYASGTTGALSEVGVDGRNSFLLKIKEVNDAGGINGRKIEALVLDDHNDPEMIPLVHEKFEAEEVEFIVGHILSVLGEAVLEEAQKEKLILSASISSALMDGIDDNFIRLASSYAGQVDHLSNEIAKDGIESLSIVYDLRNKAYAQGFYETMAEVYPGEILNVYSIGDEDSLSVSEISDLIEANPSQGVVYITPAVETAKFAQIFYTKGVEMSQYSVSWSMTNDLFIEGGKAVDGMQFVYVGISEDYTEAYQMFTNRYVQAYGTQPSTICYNTYEMTSILIEALESQRTTDITKIKNAIVGHEFEGLTDKITIDAYGDRQQQFAMYIAEGEAFIPVND